MQFTSFQFFFCLSAHYSLSNATSLSTWEFGQVNWDGTPKMVGFYGGLTHSGGLCITSLFIYCFSFLTIFSSAYRSIDSLNESGVLEPDRTFYALTWWSKTWGKWEVKLGLFDSWAEIGILFSTNVIFQDGMKMIQWTWNIYFETTTYSELNNKVTKADERDNARQWETNFIFSPRQKSKSAKQCIKLKSRCKREPKRRDIESSSRIYPPPFRLKRTKPEHCLIKSKAAAKKKKKKKGKQINARGEEFLKLRERKQDHILRRLLDGEYKQKSKKANKQISKSKKG